ncbi:hypothetical protein BY996DRAFT_4579277 [Phakopsora pachyrhizi]|nr:hypothetical protein BY996DRAFT_4579277 [Phakopsora pachyrhizi]
MATVHNSSSSSTTKKRPSPNQDNDAAHLQKRLHQTSAPAAELANRPGACAVPHSENQGLRPESRLDCLQREILLLFELEYQEEALQYMLEMDTQTRPSVETIDVQPELQWFMRPYLIDFLIEIHQQYRLRPETLYLAVNIIDRYVSKRIVFKKHYQLVGCSALWIAAKYEDSKDRVPTVAELSKMCCGAYEESSFTQMEGHVLSTIDWKLGHPTCEAWLRAPEETETSPSKVMSPMPPPVLEPSITGHVSRFIMEISLFHRSYVNLRSSHIAAGALILSRYILGQPRRIEEEKKETLAVVKLLDTHLGDHFSTISAVVMRKYSYAHYSRASAVVKEWYARGNRCRLSDPLAMVSATKADIISGHNVLPSSSSAPDLSAQQRMISSCRGSNVSMSSSISSTSSTNDHSSNPRNPYLTPSSISSLSLESSPTSSVSSFMSSSISSPQSSRSSSILVESRRMVNNTSIQQSHDDSNGSILSTISECQKMGLSKYTKNSANKADYDDKENHRPARSAAMLRET